MAAYIPLVTDMITQPRFAAQDFERLRNEALDYITKSLRGNEGWHHDSTYMPLQAKGAVQVPASALIFRSGGPQVARVDNDGKINFQNVTIARDDGNVVELGSGVAAGDRLALNVSSQILDGDRVQANQLDPGTPHNRVSTAQR